MLRGLIPLLWIVAATSAPAVPNPEHASGPWPHGSGAAAARPPAPGQTLPGNLPFFYDLYTFRGEAGRTAIVAAYAVEAGRLRREDAAGSAQYRLVVSLVLADTAAKSVARTDDSVTIRLPRSPSRDHLLRTHMEAQGSPSLTTLQRVIISDVTRPGVGQLYYGPFAIPDYSGSGLMLSDVALADPSADDGWKRRGATLALLPTGRLPEGTFTLYYEIYNLPAGTPYTTEISIERADDDPDDPDDEGYDAPGGGREVRTRFAGESTAGPDDVVAELRRVESPLPEGRYRLTITITDEISGQSAERSRPFRIGG